MQAFRGLLQPDLYLKLCDHHEASVRASAECDAKIQEYTQTVERCRRLEALFKALCVDIQKLRREKERAAHRIRCLEYELVRLAEERTRITADLSELDTQLAGESKERIDRAQNKTRRMSVVMDAMQERLSIERELKTLVEEEMANVPRKNSI